MDILATFLGRGAIIVALSGLCHCRESGIADVVCPDQGGDLGLGATTDEFVYLRLFGDMKDATPEGMVDPDISSLWINMPMRSWLTGIFFSIPGPAYIGY
jgi:hypothetical protein